MTSRFCYIIIIYCACLGQLAAQDLGFDQRLSQMQYPFKVALHKFDSQGKSLEMAYMYLPPRDNQPIFTLMHGKNFTSAYWENTAKWLHAQGYGVLMADQIGFGKSSKPVNYQYSFAGLARNTTSLLKKLGIKKTYLVGHSMGGMLAARFALLQPNRVSQLILINPIGLENYLHYVEYKDPAFFVDMELESTPAKIQAYQTKNYYDGQWNEQLAEHAKHLFGWLAGEDWQTIAQVSALTYDMIFTQPVIEEFADFQIPVSLILGTRDRTGPGRNWKKPGINYELGRYDQLGQQVQAINPAIKVLELKGLGHLPHIENPKIFQKTLKSVLANQLPDKTQN